MLPPAMNAFICLAMLHIASLQFCVLRAAAKRAGASLNAEESAEFM